MRIFISVEFGKQVKDELRKIQARLPEFQENLRFSSPSKDKTFEVVGKKTENENLHLTLKFLGEIDEHEVDIVREKLREVKLKKFESELDEIGVFNPSFIKIIWISLKNCEGLQAEIDKALLGLFKTEERFMGHVTIARVKNVKDKKRFVEKIREIKVEKVKFKVDRFYLMESKLSEKGPEYRVVEEYKLG